MELIAQSSAYQYTHDYVEVSEWHPDRGACGKKKEKDVIFN